MSRKPDLSWHAHLHRYRFMRWVADMRRAPHLRQCPNLRWHGLMQRDAYVRWPVYLCWLNYVSGCEYMSGHSDMLGIRHVYSHEDMRSDLDLPWQRDLHRINHV